MSTIVAVLAATLAGPAAFASSVSSAVFSGTGTVTVTGTVYAKSGTVLTLTGHPGSSRTHSAITPAYPQHQYESACLKILRHADFAFNAGIGHPPTGP
ncbi:hypothetical protein ABIB15_000614 [Marisediminicola sp. UYEF4]|uniref:hypothetical protein n=1 Tax=Marisediminicola sp. UYEF4 TaxID=1756384 RepID=UPI003394A0DC